MIDLNNQAVNRQYLTSVIYPNAICVEDIDESLDKSKEYILTDGRILSYMPKKLDLTYTIKPGGLWGTKGWSNSSGYEAINTNTIEVSPGDAFSYTGNGRWNINVYWLNSSLDSSINIADDPSIISKHLVSYTVLPENATLNHVENLTITVPSDDNIKYAVFVSYYGTSSTWTTDKTFDVKSLDFIPVLSNSSDILDTKIMGRNILSGKKYVACGDSFTNPGGTITPYPDIIAQRNDMEFENMGLSGADFTNIEGASNPFSSDAEDVTFPTYKKIPEDADYITFMFGLNECGGDATNKAALGEVTDTTNNTVCGAYYTVFNYLLSHEKLRNAKIGVIIADSWMPTTYSNKLKEICNYWCIPYLDLGRDDIPHITNNWDSKTNKYNDDILTPAQRLRNEQFKVCHNPNNEDPNKGKDNGHPNQEAHNFRSTIIENFLRSL